MKQHFLGSLTAAFVVTAFGAPLSAHAQPDDSDLRSPQTPADSQEPPSEESLGFTDSSVSSTDTEQQTSISDLIQPNSEHPFSIHSHALDERQAATLYVRSVPVLTFVGAELDSLRGDKSLSEESEAEAATSIESPAARARLVQVALEEFRQSSQEADDIVARWDAEQEHYEVSLGETTLVSIDSQTFLPDTTEEPAEDALQVANRLRRLLMNGPPLEDVIDRPTPPASPQLAVASATTGIASWYGPGFHGRRSASGEIFNQNALTAAHRTLPFGTQVRVTNLHTQQQVVVRINDRGPFSHNRVIDLSAAAARAIGLHISGVGPVRVEVLANP